MKTLGISAILGVILGLGLISVFEFQSRTSEFVILSLSVVVAGSIGTALARIFKSSAPHDKPAEPGNA